MPHPVQRAPGPSQGSTSQHVAVVARGAPADDEPPPYHRHVVWGVVAGAGSIALAGLLLGSWPIKIAAVVIALTVLQGLWRGCAEIIGLVVGMALAALTARGLGRAVEGMVASVVGTAGLGNRVLSVVLVAVVITGVVGIAGSVVAKRLMKRRPDLRAYDRYAGAGLGLVEGCFVAMLILWVPIALRPVAQIVQADDRELQSAPGAAGRSASPPWAGGVIAFAEATESSFVGGLVSSTNPLPDSRLLSLAGDFALISRDEQALTELLQSEPMQRLGALPSVQQAMEAIKGDPEVSGLMDEGGVTPERIAALFSSAAVLRVLDTTTVVQDASPIVDQLAQTIREIRARLDERHTSGTGGGRGSGGGGGG